MIPLFVPGAGLSVGRPSLFVRDVSCGTCRRVCTSVSQTRGPRQGMNMGSSTSADDARKAASARALEQAGSGVSVSFGSLRPAARNAVVALAAAAAGVLGFVGVPRNFQDKVKPVAAGVAAVSVGLGVKRLEKGKERAAKKALAKLMGNVKINQPEFKNAVDQLEEKFGLDSEQRISVCRSIYELFLLEILGDRTTRYSEMSDLVRLKRALSLPGAAIGDSHYEVARAFYRNNVVYLDAEDDDAARDDSQAKLDKLFFLSDRMYADKDTEEAYNYEISRVCRFYSFPVSEFKSRAEKVALPFYKDVVLRACTDATLDAHDIQAAQAALGLRDLVSERVRLDSYADTVNRLVTEKGKLDEKDNAFLAKIRGLLGIEDDRATSTQTSLAEPIYRTEVLKALDKISNRGDESYASVYGRLALRQADLGLPADSARRALASESSARASELVKKARKFLRVQNIGACVKAVRELLDYVDNVASLVAVSSNEEPDAEAEETRRLQLIASYVVDLNKSLSRTEPLSLYRLYLSDILAERVVSKSEERQLRRLRTILGISDAEAMEAFKTAAGPVYRKTLVEAFSTDSFDDVSKEAKNKVKAELALPEETAKSIDLDLYRERLSRMTEGNRILQEQEAQLLFVIRQYLGLSSEDVASVHRDCCGSVYEQSVSEAMGATGIMLDEYRQGLERLRNRLALTKDDADAAYYRVVKKRMRMYVDRALLQLEKRSSLRGQNEERDVGDDPNIKRAGATLGIDAGGLPIELHNLVDFYVRNKLPVEEEVDSEKEGEKKVVTRYPVTLRGEIQPRVYNELYKQYVIQCFSAQTRDEKQRLFASLDQLGPILGMTDGEVSAIHSSIGTVIYKNYVDQSLLKGPLVQQDMDFLSNIQRMLSMKEDHCAKILKEAKNNRVSVLLERIFSQPKVLPETVKNMRSTAKALDVDIVGVLSITRDQRKRLFSVEVDDAIDRGALSAEKQELLDELQSDLQVPKEDAQEVLLGCIQRRTLAHLVQASASLRQDRSDLVVSELRRMLRYGKLLPAKVPAPAVSDSEKQEMYLLFQADAITDGAMNQEATENLNILKTLLGFTDADLEAHV